MTKKRTHYEEPAGEATAVPAAGPVLIQNTSRGIHRWFTNEPADIPQGANGVQRYVTHSVILLPGLNLVDGDKWERMADCPNTKMQRENRKLRIHQPFSKMADRECIDLVKESADIRTLAALYKLEADGGRLNVVEALRERLAQVTRDGDERTSQSLGDADAIAAKLKVAWG